MLSTISIPEEWRIDAQPFINRPFFLTSINWPNTVAQYRILPSSISKLPGDVIRSNTSLLNAMKMGSYYRQKLHLNISLAGTITHAGCLLVGVIPPLNAPLDTTSDQSILINTLLSGPHAFLNANEATSVDLAVPWYCNTDVASLDVEENASSATDMSSLSLGNYGTLVFLVMNQLAPSSGSSVALNIIVDAIFHNLDILIPSARFVNFVSQSLETVGSSLVDSAFQFAKKSTGDAIDEGRKVVRELTGLHNPNFASINNRMITSPSNFLNAVDTTQYFQKLDPFAHRDRIVREPIFNTDIDEMQLKHILSKPQFISSFKVRDIDGVGTLKFCRPISPYQGGLGADRVTISNNIELLYWFSRAWSGDLKIYIQAVMNNKQQVKLRLFNMYNVSRRVLTGYPVYKDILNSPSHLMEFTAGGQIQTVSIPFLCRTEQLYCARDLSMNALMHGMYYIYVAQQLANSADSPTDVSFNIYMSAENVKFYGYSTDVANSQFTVVKTIAPPAFKSESLNVMNEPAPQNDLIQSEDNVVEDLDNRCRLMQVIDVRPFIRRMYKAGNTAEVTRPLNISPFSTGISSFNLGVFIGETLNNVGIHHPARVLSNMFYGKSAGLKVKLIPTFKFESTSNDFPTIRYVIQYLPPDQFWNGNLGYVASSISEFQNSAPVIETLRNSTDIYPLEFEVPNMNCYKFIGGPSKMSTQTKLDPFSDLGHVKITVFNVEPVEISNLSFDIYIGFSDETRLGFHCIAPGYSFSDNSQIYTAYSTGTIFSPQRNKFLYFG